MTRIRQAGQALRMWTAWRWAAAATFSVLIGWALGIVTVLIPNTWFHRDIPPTVWSYPVWIVTALLAGMLTATYVSQRPRAGTPNLAAQASPTSQHAAEDGEAPASQTTHESEDGKSSVWGMVGTFGAWFAIGCPVCNKLALVALGYSGAITYFAPLQPWLAAVSLVLLVVGLVVRLAGEVACPVRA